MKWNPALVMLLTLPMLYWASPRSVVIEPQLARDHRPISRSARLDKLMKDVEAFCSEPESAGCIQALNRIEPCPATTPGVIPELALGTRASPESACF